MNNFGHQNTVLQSLYGKQRNMNNKKEIGIIFLISLGLSITLGMIDYETESFWHLLTSDPGNIPTLLIFTLVFMGVGVGILQLFRSLQKHVMSRHDMSELD